MGEGVTVAGTLTPAPAVDDSWLESTAAVVARRIPDWFRERYPDRAILRDELISRAWSEHIMLAAWEHHDAVRATGLRSVLGTLGGRRETFYILETES